MSSTTIQNIIIPWPGYSVTIVFTDKRTPMTKANMMAVVIGGIFIIPISIEQTDEYHKGVRTMTVVEECGNQLVKVELH